MYDFDFRPLFWFAMIGLGATALAVIVGVPALVWWLVLHVAFV